MCTNQGNEGVDVKEGCMGTVIENNEISMQHDANSGGMLATRCCYICAAMNAWSFPVDRGQ